MTKGHGRLMYTGNVINVLQQTSTLAVQPPHAPRVIDQLLFRTADFPTP